MIKVSNILSSLIIFYLYWIAFEWTLLSPINNLPLIQIIRSTIDTLPLLLMLLYLFVTPPVITKYGFKILLSVSLLLLLSIISLQLENQNLISIAKNMGVTFRFVPFIILAKFSNEKVSVKFLSHIKIIFWIHVVLAILQLINNAFFIKFFLPNPEIFGLIIPPSSYREFAINTSFINTIEFSFFILALSVVYIFNTESKSKRWKIFIITLILVALSRSTATVLSMAIVGFYMSNNKQIYPILLIIPAMIMVMFSQVIFSNLIGTNTLGEWIESSARFSRIGYFTNLLPQFFSSNLKDVFLGMGLDADTINNKLSFYYKLPLILTYGGNNLILLKDVYWIAVIVSQGVIGLSVFISIFISIYSFAKQRLAYKDFIIVKVFILIIILLGFFNQVLDVKGFSFIFWAVIGISFNNVIKNERTKDTYCST